MRTPGLIARPVSHLPKPLAGNGQEGGEGFDACTLDLFQPTVVQSPATLSLKDI